MQQDARHGRTVGSPRPFASFLLWMPSDLFQVLPIAGAPEKPNLVFFFDEAHWLFGDAPKVAVDRV